MDGIDLNEISSLKEQRASGRSIDTGSTSEVPEGMDDEKDSCDFEGVGRAKEMDSSSIRGKLREVQRVYEDAGNAVSTTIVKVNELALEGIGAKRKIATMFSRQKDLESKLVEMRAARRMMSCQISAAEEQEKYLKAQLLETELELEKLTDDSSRTEAELQADMSVVEV